jgi:hypothetical protein
MKRLYNFCRLPALSRHLFVRSFLLLALVRVGLWVLPFKTLRRLLARMTRPYTESPGEDQTPLERVAWAVTVASQYVPAATCLTQALVTQMLLRRRGLPASLRLGVARGAAGEFLAHAWVECQGRVVIGGGQAPARFTPFPPLDGERP